MEERCNLFAATGMQDPNWAFHSIVRFLQFQRERVEREEITGATLRNSVKSIKLFCEMTDDPIAWKRSLEGYLGVGDSQMYTYIHDVYLYNSCL